jgi:hypothetical protein
MYPFVHSDEIGEIIGNFHGIPVRAWDKKASEVRELAETRLLIYNNRKSEAKAQQQATVANHEYVDAYGIIQPSTALTAAHV